MSRFDGRDTNRKVSGFGSLALAMGLGLIVTVSACSRSGGPVTANPAAPSAAEASASLDHSGTTGQHRHFTAGVSPSSVQANQTAAVLSVTVSNCGGAIGCADGASTRDLGRAEIVVPSGLTVTAVGNFIGAQPWGTNWLAGQTVAVGATGSQAGQQKLAPGQSVTFDLTVNTPAVCDIYGFQTPRGSQDTLDATTPDWNFEFYGAGLSVEVTGCGGEEECPAAPSIAAHYLKDLGFHPNSPDYRNIVAQVAHHMGPGTDFDGVGKCDAEYEQAVRDFVDGLLP